MGTARRSRLGGSGAGSSSPTSTWGVFSAGLRSNRKSKLGRKRSTSTPPSPPASATLPTTATSARKGSTGGEPSTPPTRRASTWERFYDKFSANGEYFNLAPVEDMMRARCNAACACADYDAYYDDVPTSGWCGNYDDVEDPIPGPAVLRRATACLLEHVPDAATHAAPSTTTVQGILVDLLALGNTAMRLGVYEEDDLHDVVRATRACSAVLQKKTTLLDHRDVAHVFQLLQTPSQLHAVLLRPERSDTLRVLLACVKCLLLELTLPQRTPSPADHAVKAEVLMDSNLTLAGAVGPTSPTAAYTRSPA